MIFPIERAPEGCACLPLSSCRSVLVVRSGHSLARRFDEAGGLTLEECLAHRYVEVRPGPDWVLRAMDASVFEAWIARPRAVRTPYFFSAVQMVRRSDLCLTCSETLAREVAGTDEFRILPLPEECSKKWVPKLVWHERGHRDPAMQWLRSVITSLVHEQDSGR